MKVLRYDGPGGRRLDKYILEQLPELSFGWLHKYAKQNKIKCDGKKVPLATVLQGVETEVGEFGDFLARGPDPEHPARVLRTLLAR